MHLSTSKTTMESVLLTDSEEESTLELPVSSLSRAQTRFMLRGSPA
jgi:hypothetical protein